MALPLDAARVTSLSVGGFSFGAVASFLCLNHLSSSANELSSTFLAISALSAPVLAALLFKIGRKIVGEDREIALSRSLFLGATFGSGVAAVAFSSSSSSSAILTVGIYVSALSFFHYSEFLSTALWNPRHLSSDSFLLNHSTEYEIALAVSWLEFLVEWYAAGHFDYAVKDFDVVARCGLGLVLAGDFCRKLAMWTAQSNFNHLIQWEKNPEHVLVTHGIYSLSRHPSYVGWFLWSVGTQILLKNPLCTIAYAAVSWRFFNERIREEEQTLINFFGEAYLGYQEKVGTGLPGVKGFLLDEEQKAFVRRKWAWKGEARGK